MMKRYGLILYVTLLSASVCAMELNDGMEEPHIPAWKRALSGVVWLVSPFEVVDRNDAERQKYKTQIRAAGYQKAEPENFNEMAEFERQIWKAKKEKLGSIPVDDDTLPTRNQILIHMYGRKCLFGRTVLRFVHGKPYSYFASALYYIAGVTVVVKGAKKIRNIWNAHKEGHPADVELKRADAHPDCPWCKGASKRNEQ